MTLRVTVLDVETGDTDSCDIAEGDYLLLVHDPCHLAEVVKVNDGETHLLTVKGRTVVSREDTSRDTDADLNVHVGPARTALSETSEGER